MDPTQMMMQQQMGQGPDRPTPGDNVDNPQAPDQQMLQEQGQQQQQADPVEAIKTLILRYATTDLNVDIQSKGILALASAIKTLTDAANPNPQGADPQVMTQIEVQKHQHEMQLKEAELRSNIQLKQAELQMKVQMTQAKIEQSRQDAQVKTAQAQQDAQIKQQEAADKQAVTSQNAQIQAAQAEQKMAEQAQAHKKAMTAPAKPSGGSK